MSKKKTVEIHLGYYKQGDDLGECLRELKDPYKALRGHADQMRSVGEHIDKIAAMVNGHKIKIEADTHMIMLTCNEILAKKLLDAKLAYFDEESAENS
jgi:SepF-like predicted cell division protein (DUF552 family)